jgi:hypothetical protein
MGVRIRIYRIKGLPRGSGFTGLRDQQDYNYDNPGHPFIR